MSRGRVCTWPLRSSGAWHVLPLDVEVLGVLLVASESPARFRFAGAFDASRLGVPSFVVGSTTDPWLPIDEARTLAQRWNSAFVNLRDAGHVDV